MRTWLTTLVMALGVVGFSVLVAPWGVLGLWLRHVILLLFIAALVVSLRRPPVPDSEQVVESPVRSLVKVVIGIFFGGVAVSAIGSHAAPDGALALTFPLRGGSFLVLHGGSKSATNLHWGHPQQHYALDIVKIGSGTRRASGFFPGELDAYAMWGSEVVSPCSGNVLAAVDGLPDQKPGSVDAKNVAGNHVVIRCGNADVWLAHLQRGSVQVRAGMPIEQGTRLGVAGNSGNTTEPHLHVHAERDGKSVPVRFDGEWLVRNAIVRK